jgi:hypothetical protein
MPKPMPKPMPMPMTGSVIVLLFGTMACRQTPPAPRIVEVQVIDRTPPDARMGEFDATALEARAREDISRSSGLLVGDNMAQGGWGYRLRLEIRREAISDPQVKEALLRAYVTAHLSPIGAPVGTQAFDQAAAAERKIDIARLGDRNLWGEHLARAVGDVLGTLGGRVRLWRGGTDALLTALTAKDEELRDEAILLVGDRHERAAVPALLALLRASDAAVRDRAIGALAAIGDRRAVRPLTEVAHFRDLEDLPKILDALSTLGGDEARAYLELVASGHESPEMRDLAKQALIRLDRRAGAAAAKEPS